MNISNSTKETIVLEWLKVQDLSKLTPVEAFQKYKQAYDEIVDESKKDAQPMRIS